MSELVTRIRGRASGVRPSEPAGVALWLFANAALWTALVSLVTINKVKDVAVAVVLHGGAVSPAMLARTVGSLDVVLALLAAISVGLLVWSEVRWRAVSGFLRTATERQAFVGLTIAAVWTGHAYLSPGVLRGGDTATHISRFLEVARGLQHGSLPTWTNYQYLGAPLLWFTGPLTYVIGGAITVMVGDAVAGFKIFLFACHIAGAWLFFALMRRFGFRPVPALIASIGFTGCFAHLHLFLYRGVAPQALTIVGLVLLFWAAEGAMTRRGRPWVNWTMIALATAGLIANHQPHALFVAFYLAVFGAVSLMLGRWRWPGLPMLVLAALCGVVMAAVAVVPVLFEADWVMIDPASGQFLWHVPTLVRLGHLVMWRDTRTTWGFDYWAYLGISLVLLGLLGLWSALRGSMGPERRRLGIATGVCLGFSLFLFNPVVRDVIFLFFLLAILVGIGVERLAPGGRVLLAVTALVFADVGSTSIQPVARNDKGFALEAGRVLERIAPNERMVELDFDADGTMTADVGPDAGPVYYEATVQRIAGNHNMAATRVHNYAVSAAALAEADLRRDKRLDDATRQVLELLNVTRLVCQSPIASGCPADFGDAVTEDRLGRVVKLDGIPLLFSRDLVELAPPVGFDKPMLWPGDFSNAASAGRVAGIDDFLRAFAAVERPDPVTRMSAAIAVRSLDGLAGHVAGEADWRPIVSDYTVGLEDVSIRIESNGAGYLQIAHPWFPATRVLIDGRPVVPLQGAIDLMVVPVHAGVNVIDIRPGTTPIRLVSAWISVLGVLLTGFGAFVVYRRADS